MKKIYEFYKEKGLYAEADRWYVNLPDYPGPKAELEMVEGADKMLDYVLHIYCHAQDSTVRLYVDTVSFEGSSQLIMIEGDRQQKEIVETCGGRYYFLEFFEDQEVNIVMWLCPVMEYVFGTYPEFVYIKPV